MKWIILPVLLFLVLSLSVNEVYAEDIDLTEFDDKLGEALGVGAFAGGLLLSFLILFLFLGILGLVTKKTPTMFTTMLLGFAILSACIAIGWFPVWSLVFLVLLVAFQFGSKIVRSVS